MMSVTKPIDLSIIIVNWNQPEFTAACVSSILKADLDDTSYEMILVDNGSTLDKLAQVRELTARHSIRLIENQRNAGFASANNLGLKVAAGRYILLLNNDTEILPDALTNMIIYLDHHPEAGIVGAQLLNLDGSPQFSCGLFPVAPWQRMMDRVVDVLQPRNQWTYRSRSQRLLSKPGPALEVDWVLGAALMIRRTVVETIGQLDEIFFMYAEDIDWCYRAKQAGWSIICLRNALVYHHHRGSAKNSPELTRQLNRENQHSMELFYAKSYGQLAAQLLHLIHLRKRFSDKLRGQ